MKSSHVALGLALAVLLALHGGCSSATHGNAPADAGHPDFATCNAANGVSSYTATGQCPSCVQRNCESAVAAFQADCVDYIECQCANASADCQQQMNLDDGCSAASTTLQSCLAASCGPQCLGTTGIDSGPQTGCANDADECLCAGGEGTDTCDTTSFGGSICRNDTCYCSCSPYGCQGSTGSCQCAITSVADAAQTVACTGALCCVNPALGDCLCFASGTSCSASDVKVASCNLSDVKPALEATTQYGALVDSCTGIHGSDPTAASCTATGSSGGGSGSSSGSGSGSSGGGSTVSGCDVSTCADGSGCYCTFPINSPGSVCDCSGAGN